MGWSNDMATYAREHNIPVHKQILAMEELVAMTEWAYQQAPQKWQDHRDRAESHIYGWHFTKDCAERAVAAMQNEDGSVGQYWSYKDVEDLAKNLGIDFTKEKFNLPDLYYTLNMIHSDFYEANMDPQVYIRLGLQYLRDKDAPEGKAKIYYMAMKKAKEEK